MSDQLSSAFERIHRKYQDSVEDRSRRLIEVDDLLEDASLQAVRKLRDTIVDQDALPEMEPLLLAPAWGDADQRTKRFEILAEGKEYVVQIIGVLGLAPKKRLLVGGEQDEIELRDRILHLRVTRRKDDKTCERWIPGAFSIAKGLQFEDSRLHALIIECVEEIYARHGL